MSIGRFARFVGIALTAIAITNHASARAQEAAPPPAADSGVIRVKSAYDMDETLVRIKKDIVAKGVRFFDEIDQAQLAASAGIKLPASVLLVFGNPPLGIQFLTANPYACLDWPVRMLVFQDAAGQVWIAYSDFAYIANRYHITDRPAQFKMASEVAASIASSAQSKPMLPPQKP
jgi:uncharacterized protein (DUF302 family)